MTPSVSPASSANHLTIPVESYQAAGTSAAQIPSRAGGWTEIPPLDQGWVDQTDLMRALAGKHHLEGHRGGYFIREEFLSDFRDLINALDTGLDTQDRTKIVASARALKDLGAISSADRTRLCASGARSSGTGRAETSTHSTQSPQSSSGEANSGTPLRPNPRPSSSNSHHTRHPGAGPTRGRETAPAEGREPLARSTWRWVSSFLPPAGPRRAPGAWFWTGAVPFTLAVAVVSIIRATEVLKNPDSNRALATLQTGVWAVIVPALVIDAYSRSLRKARKNLSRSAIQNRGPEMA